MMDFEYREILIWITATFMVIYIYYSRSFDYWKKRGVAGPKPSIPFGNSADIFFFRKPLMEKLQEFYDFDDSSGMIGYFASSKPILMIKDPDLIKQILIKDFNVFSGRGIKINESIEPLAAHLFNIDGQRWKALRNRLTPIFTSGKLRNMFGLMLDCADTFERYLKTEVSKNNEIECREIAARYTTDVIGSCAFGIRTQALEDKNSIFFKFGQKIFEPSILGQFKIILREITPRIYRLFRLRLITPEVTKFFIETMRTTVELRKKEKNARNDFVDLLINVQRDANASGFEWTENLTAAQAFVFFAAGFESSSTTISFALWELSRSPEIQEKLRRDVLRWDVNNNGNLTYDNVEDMKYLDMVVKETLRKNPPGIMLIREATRNYKIPGTKVKISAGQRIHIPVYSLHHDPKYYPKPEVFDPERFNDEAQRGRNPMVFLPFGDGPKNCIGLRFAYYPIKLALIKIIKNFRVASTIDSPDTYVVDKNTVFLSPVDGVVLKFEPLYSSPDLKE